MIITVKNKIDGKWPRIKDENGHSFGLTAALLDQTVVGESYSVEISEKIVTGINGKPDWIAKDITSLKPAGKAEQYPPNTALAQKLPPLPNPFKQEKDLGIAKLNAMNNSWNFAICYMNAMVEEGKVKGKINPVEIQIQAQSTQKAVYHDIMNEHRGIEEEIES